jgi:hypothetical protein
MRVPVRLALLTAAAALAACAQVPQQSGNPMSFFITSSGAGSGANYGGLVGADAHCQLLAATAGAGERDWRAYLSVNAEDGSKVVNARDRIGKGPWRNAKGVVVANSVDELHGQNNLTKQTVLTESGAVVNGRGDTPNLHDVLTGSTPDGRAAPQTCANWTSESEGAAIVGHHDRTGLDTSAPAISWNSSHPTRGCSQDALKATGGAGLLYCFAAK